MRKVTTRDTRLHFCLGNSCQFFEIPGNSVVEEFETRIFKQDVYSLVKVVENENIKVGYVKKSHIKITTLKNVLFCNRISPLLKNLDSREEIESIKIGTKLIVLEKRTDDNEYIKVEVPSMGIIGFFRHLFTSKNENVDSQFYREIAKVNDLPIFEFKFHSIGIFHSCFPDRGGCPRQGFVSENSKGYVELSLSTGTCLDGLEGYSHLWLLFVFHKNKASGQFLNIQPKKIRPPRLGKKVGIFSCRSPHRINPIGLTCAKIEKVSVKERKLFLSGIDLIDGTPILDIKPYVFYSDSLDRKIVNEPDWVAKREASFIHKVVFKDEAIANLKELVLEKKLKFFKNFDEVISIIEDVVKNDPRPGYMKKKNDDRKPFGFRLDKLNVRMVVDDEGVATVVEIEIWDEL